MSEPAGWYGNPDGTASQRYWDGVRWTHDVRPLPPGPNFDPTTIQATAPDPTPPAGPLGQPPPPDDPPASAEDSASVGDVLGVLFDFGLTRPVSPALVRSGYRAAAMMTLVASALFLLVGLRGGGLGAVVSLVAFPLLTLPWLFALRVLSQILIDRSEGRGGAESG